MYRSFFLKPALVLVVALCPWSSYEVVADDSDDLARVIDGLNARTAAVQVLGVRATFHQKNRPFRGGPFRSRMQVIDIIQDDRGNVRSDLLESQSGAGVPAEIASTTIKRLVTYDAKGSRAIGPAIPKVGDKEPPPMVGIIDKVQLLFWIDDPAELTCLFNYSPLRTFLKENKVKLAGVDRINGMAVVRIDWEADRPLNALRGTFWLAPELGYAPVVQEVSRRPKASDSWRLKRRIEARDFVQVEGVWLPGKIAEVEHSYWDDGTYELRGEVAAEFEDWRINRPTPDGTFHVDFPPGTQVSDRKLGIFYTTGKIGDPSIKDLVKQARQLGTDASSAEKKPISERFNEASRSDPLSRISWSSWITAICTGVLTTIVVGVTARRWKRTGQCS